MDDRVDKGSVMDTRWSWVAGTTAIGLALLRLGRLVRPSSEGAPWQVAVLAAAILGILITWIVTGRGSRIVANAGAFVIVLLRITSPDTLIGGIVPTSATFSDMAAELAIGYDLVRFGVAPVAPVAGLVVILAAIFWALGMFMTWALDRRKRFLAMTPPLLFYLQLAIIDQTTSSALWNVAPLGVVGLGLAAVAADERVSHRPVAGRPRVPAGQALHTAGVVVAAIVIALVGMRYATAAIPPAGLIDWRNHASIGGGLLAGVSYNLFTDIRQDLISPSDTPVFTARVEGDIDRSQLYWELITLEDFDGENWIPKVREVHQPTDVTWEDPDLAFFGPTQPVTADITVQSLRQNYLPVLYSPTWLGSDSSLFNDSYLVRTDGSIRFDLLTWRGLSYEEVALVPKPDLDVLASTGGRLTPIFQEAADRGAFVGEATATPETRRPSSLTDLLDLPALNPIIRTRARELTQDGTSAFEKALLLESWFRDPAVFTYSTDIKPGHGAGDLTDWLFTTDSPNYRTGYCEQFATAMAVMARTIGIPSRVVIGFGPGDTQSDGTIIVRDRNAHAWVELWMNNQGWVRFDPTPRSDRSNPSTASFVGFDPRDYIPPPPEEIDQPAERAAQTPRDFNPDFGERPTPPGSPFGSTTHNPLELFTPTRVAILLLLLLLAAAPTAKAVRRRRRMKRLSEGDVSAAWDEIVDRLTDLGSGPTTDQTPLEVAATVHGGLVPLAERVTEYAFAPRHRVEASGVAEAAASFAETERYLTTINPPIERLRAALRLSSLLRRRAAHDRPRNS